MPSTKPFTDRHLSGWQVALILFAVAFVLRASVFGNPAPMVDDQFYALVGQRMHQGLLPYVDVWDRKPLGLFLIYWVIAGISTEPVAWQVAATLFAAGTAVTIAKLAETISKVPKSGALWAGLTYLATSGPLGGYSGQSSTFYNFFIAVAALVAYQSSQSNGTTMQGDRPAAVAALLCGVAITIKQTALFESGTILGWLLWHGPRNRAHLISRVAITATIFAAPTLSCAVFYACCGHFSAWWHAMVISNFVKSPLTAYEIHHQALDTAVRVAPLLITSLVGLIALRKGAAKVFLFLWLVGAAAGFLSVPTYFARYALPTLVPLSVAAATVFVRPSYGRPVALAVIAWTFIWYQPWDRDWQLHMRSSVTALASAAVQHDHGRGIFVYDGPTAIYTLTGRPFLSPLMFPHHLNQLVERNVSQFDTDAEVARVLANHPGVVVTTLAPRNFPVNQVTWDAVQTYVHSECHPVALVRTWDELTITPIMVWGDCAPAPHSPAVRTPA